MSESEPKNRMNEPRLEVPKSLNLSTQQRDLGETILVFTGEPGNHSIVGTIYNADDFPCLDDAQAEDMDEIAIATAEKVVLAYNCHDDLLEACDAALAYDAAIRRHAEQGALQWIQGDDLDALYKKWLSACRAAKDKVKGATP